MKGDRWDMIGSGRHLDAINLWETICWDLDVPPGVILMSASVNRGNLSINSREAPLTLRHPTTQPHSSTDKQLYSLAPQSIKVTKHLLIQILINHQSPTIHLGRPRRSVSESRPADYTL